MVAKVTLKTIQENVDGKEFLFTERTTCLIGRSTECQIQLPNDKAHQTVSRYHCLLDINPPAVRIRDFGSLNGTFINGKKIGQRQKNQRVEEALKIQFPEYDLQNGDQLKIGNTLFLVEITAPITEEHASLLFPATSLEQLELLLEQNKSEPIVEGYEILRELGKGGMGAVYLAKSKRTAQQVAIKIMLPQVAKNLQAQQTFLREIEGMKILNHPYIVRLWDMGQAQEVFFFVSEYCAGGNISQWMAKQSGKLALAEALPVLLQMLEALDYAHHVPIPAITLMDGTTTQAVGLVHRDIKPSNIYLMGTEKRRIAKLGDFGLAKAFDIAGLSGQTATGAAAGTTKFMSRQQVINFKYAKPEIDIWALVATFYYMVTGTYPREFPRDKDPWIVVLKEMPIPIRQRNPTVPKPLAEVIDTALQDNPDIPFKEALELKQAIEKVL
ncbi:MAG: serine/threonine protein kinase [Beggiatoa sp. IS2]|nr:MAG: serine/threonine protein kinase [Beggiatoa sp. IS2]